MDKQLNWPASAKRFKGEQDEKIQGYEFREIRPDESTKNLYTFCLSGISPLAFGPGTGFKVEGVFQVKEPGDDSTWRTATIEDAKSVSLQPNWFDFYIYQLDVSHRNQIISSSEVPRFIEPHISSFLYAHMSKRIKRRLCMEKQHPGNSVTVNHGNFKALGTGSSSTAENDWTRYSRHLFGRDKIEFMYTPLSFPFFQDTSFEEFKCLPVPATEGLIVRVFLREDSSNLFNKMPGNENSYRFVLSRLTLLVKEVKTTAAFVSHKMSAARDKLFYRGLSKICLHHKIPPSPSLKFGTSFGDVPLPDGLMIFCVNQICMTDRPSFQQMSLDGPFLWHEISSVEVEFGGQQLYFRTPWFGSFNHFQVQRDNFIKMLEGRAHFGMEMDPDVLEFERQGEGRDYAYPNIWIDLKEQPLMPALNQRKLQGGSSAASDLAPTRVEGELKINLHFSEDGPNQSGLYVIVAYYTGFNICFDVKAKTFFSLYTKMW